MLIAQVSCVLQEWRSLPQNRDIEGIGAMKVDWLHRVNRRGMLDEASLRGAPTMGSGGLCSRSRSHQRFQADHSRRKCLPARKAASMNAGISLAIANVRRPGLYHGLNAKLKALQSAFHAHGSRSSSECGRHETAARRANWLAQLWSR